MQIVLISKKKQASNKEQASSTEHQAPSTEQQLGQVKVLLTVERKISEGERKRSEGDSPICCFSSSHLWNVFMRLLLARSGASGRSFVFAIMVYLIVIFSTVSTSPEPYILFILIISVLYSTQMVLSQKTAPPHLDSPRKTTWSPRTQRLFFVSLCLTSVMFSCAFC